MKWYGDHEKKPKPIFIISILQSPEQLHQQDPWLGCSDEIDLTWSVHPTYNINPRQLEPSTNYHNMWGHYYKGIRSSFVFENNVDRCKEISKELKTQYKAEVKFKRISILVINQTIRTCSSYKRITPRTRLNIPRAPYDDCVELYLPNDG